MRILIDHSGYDLRNLGDVAMLQVCVARVHQALPDAELDVITTAPERLERYCPGTRPVRSTLVERRWCGSLSRSHRLALEQAWKASGPYLVRSGGQPRASSPSLSVLSAIRQADAVVAAGGGYLTDAWWWHAAGVLSVLRAAQRLGRPTAMFGQGLGPLTNPAIRRQASAALPRLRVLGLREGVTGLPLANALHMPADRVIVTGDDALELAVVAATPAPPRCDVLGVNVRFADYTNLDLASVAPLRAAIAELARRRSVTLRALPISRHACSDDLHGVAQLLQGLPSQEVALDALATPAALVQATVGCRAVVTASYHAAVFALAAGVPAVCLSSSPYYDAKFKGLVDLFPEAATFVGLDRPGAAEQLTVALSEAWDAPERVRDRARASALQQVRDGQALYDRFLNQLARPERPAPVRT